MTIEKASFKCEKAVLDEFRVLVAKKYGKLWGVLHKEFARALTERSQKLREELNSKKESEGSIDRVEKAAAPSE